MLDDDNKKPAEFNEEVEQIQPSKGVAADESEESQAVVAGVEAVGRVALVFIRIKEFVYRIWHTKKYRRLVQSGILVTIAILGIIPATRFGFLNILGFRGSVSLRVVDKNDQKPLKGANVEIGGAFGTTDEQGRLELSKVKLGYQKIKADKQAYALLDQQVYVGFKKTEFNNLKLSAIGTSFSFRITEYLSDTAIGSANLSYEQSSTTADDQGMALLNIPPSDHEQIEVTIEAKGKRSDNIKINTTTKEIIDVKMLPEKKLAFLSDRSGVLNLYKIDLDGKNEKLLLAGTGNESNKAQLAQSKDAKTVALVASREGARNLDGYILSDLLVVDVETGDYDRVDSSERLKTIGFLGDYLVYLKVVDGQSTYSPTRQSIISYNIKNKSKKTLQSTNYFNDALIVNGYVLFGADDSFKQSYPKPYLFRVKPDGTESQTVLTEQSWSLFHHYYDQIFINAGDNAWYSYDPILDTVPYKLSGEPASFTDNQFSLSSDKTKVAWVENRDGKGTLILRDLKTKEDKVLIAKGGLSEPLFFVDNSYIIYRVKTNDESANYLINIKGNEVKKISDTVNSLGEGL